MKNKRSIYTIAIIFACAVLSSCSDWLDVNHNPNSAEKVDPGYLFNYAVVNWAGSRTGGLHSSFSKHPVSGRRRR